METRNPYQEQVRVEWERTVRPLDLITKEEADRQEEVDRHAESLPMQRGRHDPLTVQPDKQAQADERDYDSLRAEAEYLRGEIETLREELEVLRDERDQINPQPAYFTITMDETGYTTFALQGKPIYYLRDFFFHYNGVGQSPTMRAVLIPKIHIADFPPGAFSSTQEEYDHHYAENLNLLQRLIPTEGHISVALLDRDKMIQRVQNAKEQKSLEVVEEQP